MSVNIDIASIRARLLELQKEIDILTTKIAKKEGYSEETLKNWKKKEKNQICQTYTYST